LLERIWIFLIECERASFGLAKADFTAVASMATARKANTDQNGICHSQPMERILGAPLVIRLHTCD
ncbi:MAG TPA: hypothetical protein PKI24_22320, partial [Nitrospira sp.]|nr:hypothetical protein [Nitrospira sp.]